MYLLGILAPLVSIMLVSGGSKGGSGGPDPPPPPLSGKYNVLVNNEYVWLATQFNHN